MSSQTISSQVSVPDYINPSSLFEGLDFGESLLTRHVSKRENPDTQPGTIPKLSSTLDVQMLAKTSAGGAQDILKGEQDDILAFSEAILALPDPVAALKEVVQVLSSENAPSIFNVSPPTVSAHLDRFPIAKADAILGEQLDAIQAKLKAQDLWPEVIMLTADPTDTPYRGRYHNQWTNWGRVGNQPTYKRVYKEFGIFAMPVHLQLGFAPLPVNPKGKAQLPAWVRNLGFALAWVASTGTLAPLVAVDREFYTAIGFGAAYLGLIAPNLAPEAQPRLLCPTRHWHSKRDPKWELLAGEDSATVAEDTMELNAQDANLLGPAAGRLATGKNGKHIIPVAVIAAFDTYSKKREPKSLEWAREGATRLKTALKAAQGAQVATNKAYMDYTRDVLHKERAPPKGKGKARRVFQDPEEAARYRACVDARATTARLEVKKGKLCKRLVFFTASLREGEHVEGREDEFIGLIRQYREHWSIENGFKSQKSDFRIRTNSRKTTARHVRAILGVIHYNAWHYRRLCQIAQVAKKTDPAWKPFDTTTPPLRKKYEQEFRPVLSARGYLLEELRRSKNACIERFISHFLSF